MARRSASAGDLLRVDRVLLDPCPGVRLVVPAAVDLALGVDDLDLQALASPRLLGDRAQRLERVGLLLDLQRGVVAPGGQGLDLLVADQPRQVRPLLVDLGDVRLLEAQPLLRLLELGQPEALQDVVVLGLRLAQLLLDLGAAAQPAGHLDVPQGLVGRLAAAQPPADDGEHEPDPGHDPADDDRDHADVDDLREGQCEADDRDRDADDDEDEGPARERAPAHLGRDLEVDLDLAFEHRPGACAILRIDGAQAVDGGAEHRQRRRRRMRALQLGDLVADRDGRAVAVVLLLGGVALGGQALGLARLLEHRPPLGEGGLGLGAVLAGHGERVAVVLETLERVLAGLEPRGGFGDGVLRHLEPTRVLDAAGLQVVERPLELALGAARPSVGAADRGLEPVAQRALVTLEPGQLVVPDRRGGAEEALGRHARDRGQLLVGSGGIGDRVAAELEAHLPLGAAERLRQPPLALLALLVLVRERQGDRGAGVGVAVPGDQPVEIGGRARDLARQRQLDRPLDRRLAGLVRAADDVEAGRQDELAGRGIGGGR